MFGVAEPVFPSVRSWVFIAVDSVSRNSGDRDEIVVMVDKLRSGSKAKIFRWIDLGSGVIWVKRSRVDVFVDEVLWKERLRSS